LGIKMALENLLAFYAFLNIMEFYSARILFNNKRYYLYAWI
jgi:hypothetical protein